MKHFKEYANPTKDNKVLLLVDGHSSHKHIDVLMYAKDNGIIMLCFPPHCTHRLQPLDVTFFGPLKIYYNQEVSKWLKIHPGRVVTQYQVSSLFSLAYGKATTISNAISGFSQTGIWLINPDMFPDHVFSATTTERPIQEYEKDLAENNENETGNTEGESQPRIDAPETPAVSSSSPALTPQTVIAPSFRLSPSATPSSSNATSLTATSSSSFLKPVDISPLPSASQVKSSSRKSKHGGAQVLTSSPYLAEVKAKVAEKKLLESRRAARKAKIKLQFSDNEDEDFELDDGDDDVACIYCNDLFSYSKPKETWLRCMKCSMWAHSECAGLPKRAKKFTCDLCKEKESRNS